MSRPLNVGVLTVGYGPFKSLGDDGLRGVQIAVDEVGGMVAGRPIHLAVNLTDATPNRTMEVLDELLTENTVDYFVGPLSGNEGLAVRNIARHNPQMVFLNGTSGAQELTIHNSPPNFFSFAPNGVQVIAGLGEYAYKTLRFRNIVTIAEDYSFPHAQVGSFQIEFGRAGGHVIEKLWVPLATNDYTEVIRAIPDEADAVLVLLGGTDAIEFISQYEQAGRPKPMLGGSITADQTVLSASNVNTQVLHGMIACGPTADDFASPEWKRFVENYRRLFPTGLNYPSYFAICYYLNMKASLLALQQTGGETQPDVFIPALNKIHFRGPSGLVSLDDHRQAITTNFVVAVASTREGTLYRKQLLEVQNVSQTIGMNEHDYLKLGWFTRDNPRVGQFEH